MIFYERGGEIFMGLFAKKNYIFLNKLTDLLPVGSVLLLNDNKKVMIYDYYEDESKSEKEKNTFFITYGYIACGYPPWIFC